jgi:hypothetical protein
MQLPWLELYSFRDVVWYLRLSWRRRYCHLLGYVSDSVFNWSQHFGEKFRLRHFCSKRGNLLVPAVNNTCSRMPLQGGIWFPSLWYASCCASWYRKWGRLYKNSVYECKQRQINTNISPLVCFAMEFRYVFRPSRGHHQVYLQEFSLGSWIVF